MQPLWELSRKFRYLLAGLVLALPALCSEKPPTFSLPDSTLLFAGSWKIEIATDGAVDVISLPLPLNPKENYLTSALPTICANGTLVASGFPVSRDSERRWKVRVAVGIYSRSEKQWRTFGNFNQVHTGAFSPDCSRLAFVADEGDSHSESREVLLLQVDSGEITQLAKIAAVWISWSPDARRLAIGTSGGSAAPQVKILDLDSHTMHELVSGTSPSWSPQGDWIAYVDASSEKVHLIHPDGTGDCVVADVSGASFAGDRSFAFGPVWSPDESKLLLNYDKGPNLNSRDVMLLDLTTGKMARKSHNGDPILGWASVQSNR